MFSFDYLVLFKDFPPELATVLIAALPITELRVSLPMALGIYKMSVVSAYFWSVIGNIIPIFFILWLLEPVSKLLIRKSKVADRFFSWLFERTRSRFSEKYFKYGEIALVIFVAIPLPMTGGWTGAVAAFLFGIPKKTSFLLIALGILIAGLIVSLVSVGSLSFIKIF